MTNNILIETQTLYISKSSIHNGEMRWSAVNSDTDWDLYGERMSLELYRSMIGKIQSKSPPPEMFAPLVTSDFWKGGMPYLSIAHYSDGNGRAVPGDVRELFIDGTRLKARGILHNTPLGRAVWKSLKEDELNYKNDLDADRIRISIAFLDLAHKHGDNGEVFKRNALTDVCPECLRGVGEKIYVDGYLVHLALTRVPVNPRTIMEAEDIMSRKAKPTTRKEDAVAVLGDEVLAEEVEKFAMEIKSDVLVEMSDTPEPGDTPETPVVEDDVPANEPPAVAEEIPAQLASLVRSLVEEAMSKKKDDAEAEEDDKEKEPKAEKKSDTASTSPVKDKSALELSVDKLYNVINGVVGKSITSEEKLQEVQPVLEELGQTIIQVVRASTPNDAQPAPATTNDAVLEAIQSLSFQVRELGTEVATMKAQVATPKVENSRVPVPRSIAPQVAKSAVTEQPSGTSIRDIARRSVGL